MRKNKFIPALTILFCSLVIIGCTKKPPTVTINLHQPTILTDEEIVFSIISTDATTYSWDFGDGTTSDKLMPVKKYSKGGDYTITLTAYSKNKKESTSTTSTIKIIQHNFSAKANGQTFKGVAEASVSNQFLVIAAGDYYSHNGVFMAVYYDSVAVGNSYTFTDLSGPNLAMGGYILNGDSYSAKKNDNLNSKLLITAFDRASKKISGTFKFTATLNTNSVNITDGVFTGVKW
jgi:PKD repeat protein